MKFEGILPALITPLDKDERVKVPVVEKYIDWLVENGADGFYVGGASGEGVLLSKTERMILAEAAVGQTKKRVKTIVHVGSINFKEALELARHAEKIGADAISAIPPLYFKYDNKSIRAYYEELAGSTSLPLVIYNTPAAGYLLDGAFSAELCTIPNVTAVKWTSPRCDELIRLISLTDGKVNVLNGPDESMLMGLCAGADGAIGVSYSIALGTAKNVYSSFKKGDMDSARTYQKKLTDLVKTVYSKYPSIAVSKAVLESRGFDFGDAVFPQRKLTSDEKKEVVKLVEEALK